MSSAAHAVPTFELGRDEDGDAFGWVHVRRAVVLASTGETQRGRRTAALVGTPKTDAGLRTVSVPEVLLPTVREHLLRHAAPGKDGLLFPSDRDPAVHLSETTLNGRAAVLAKAWALWCAPDSGGAKRNDVPGAAISRCTTSATPVPSSAGEEGASMAEAMYRLGHSTPAMAMRYQHSRLERDRDLGRRLSARAQRSAT